MKSTLDIIAREDLFVLLQKFLVLICYDRGHAYNQIILPDDSVLIFEPQTGTQGYMNVATREAMRQKTIIL